MAKTNSSCNVNVNNTNVTVSNNNDCVTKVKKRTRRSVPRDSPPQRTSIYRGVTRHRWTGRYESHLWDKNCWNESQNKKGRQVYLGAYDDEEVAARAYDLAALKYWGEETILNFPLATYEKELKEMEGLSREEYIGSLRRKTRRFSRGVSKYRGVARHHHNGGWEAQIGRVFGNKYLYLGTYDTQEETVTAYDTATLEYRGLNTVTNFDLSHYIKWLKPNQIATDNNTVANNKSNNNNFIVPFQSNLSLNTTTTTTTSNLSFLHTPQAYQPNESIRLDQPRLSNAKSALGLLLQSSKFKEMMEMAFPTDSNSKPLELDATTETELDTVPCTFSDDIQTYFESTSYGEGENINFGALSNH